MIEADIIFTIDEKFDISLDKSVNNCYNTAIRIEARMTRVASAASFRRVLPTPKGIAPRVARAKGITGMGE